MKKILLFIMALMPFVVSCENEDITNDSNDNGAIPDYGDYFDGKLYYQIDRTALEFNNHYVSVVRCDTTVESVTIPSHIKIKGIVYECKRIETGAFSSRSRLISITIPESVTSIGNEAFLWCSGLTAIIVEEGNTVYDSRDNCNAIIETTTNTLIAGCKSTVIPNSVTSIGFEAFSGCSGLISITIPESITSIGFGAFSGCSGLISITIPESITSIGHYAFINCNGLASITVEEGNTVYDSRDNCNAIIETETNTLVVGCKSTIIPNSVTSIGEYAFYNCGGLTSITIPEGVTSIETSAFAYCSGLLFITCNCSTPPNCHHLAFSSYNIQLFVPKGSKSAYENKYPWFYFNIIEQE